MAKLPPEETAEPFVPETSSLPKVRAAAEGCRGCHLWKRATQTVFGLGPKRASVMFVGEQPGDQEDLSGIPFVGPAGKLLDRCLDDAGIDRSETYVTNTVKHFKWEPRGKRRLHKKPNALEIQACRPWLEKELELIKPRVVVLLGATAAQAILGPKFKVTQNRGEVFESQIAPHVIATVHPSSLLRAPDEEARREGIAAFIEDLKIVRRILDE
jgi:DNA polymerase